MPTPKKSAGLPESTLHVLFAIGSAMLLAVTVYTFYQDQFTREFPKYQQAFYDEEIKRMAAERKKINDELGDPELLARDTELKDKVTKAEADTKAKQSEIDKVKKEASDIQDKIAQATTTLNFKKADYDEAKSQLDSGVLKSRARLDKLEDEIRAAQADQFNLNQQRNVKLAEIAKLQEGVDKAKKDEIALFASLNDLRVKMKQTRGSPVINAIKEAPGANFVQPLYNINDHQLLIPNLNWSVFFSTTPRVDRCMVCHVSIDNPDPVYAEMGQEVRVVENGKEVVTVKNKDKKVLKSHPRLDLFVGANSKHPAKKFGCTICHNGQPAAVSFSRAAHSPQDRDQANYWKYQYDWAPMEGWDAKMLPLQHTEASCAKCHKNVDEVPEAAKLNEGRHLFRDRGCTNCHFGASGPSEVNWVGRVGPDLRRIGEKTNREWARVWIENPWEFRPSTKMPRFFGLENRTDLNIQHSLRDSVEAEAIASYIFMASKIREQAPPVAKEGNVEEGRKLYAAVGCVGCHSTRDAAVEKDRYDVNPQQHGPDLSRIGEKVSAGWLYQWVKNPRHYWAETKMPNLRLSDDEAANLTSYLMSTMKSKETLRRPEAYPTDAFDAIIIDKLENTTPADVVKERLKNPVQMVKNQLKLKVKYASRKTEKGEERYDTGDGEWTEAQINRIEEIINQDGDPVRAAKVFYTGEALIQHHGCYGCHNIQGWTYAPLTAVNLSGEADKDLDKFDFGKAHHDPSSIPDTKWDWIFTKISRPRVFDRDKETLIKPFDRLRMPWFGYTPSVKDDPHAAAGAEKPEHPKAEKSEGGEKAEAHNIPRKYAPENNRDVSSKQVLGKHEVERLVTFVMSLTNEAIPGEMQRQPTPADTALDRGRRVIRELNCIGCHMASIGTAVTGNDGPATMPLAAFVASLAPKSIGFMKSPGNGIYADEDLVSLDFKTNDTSLVGFINVQRGTYLNSVTVPIVLGETKVRTSPILPWEQLDFHLEKAAKDDTWKKYGDLVTQDEFIKMTELFFEPKSDDTGKRDYADAKAGYATLGKMFCDPKAYERMAGTMAMKLTSFKLEERQSDRKFYEPVMIKVRLTRGEGRIMNHMITVEKELFKNETATQQHAPPSLSWEGGKVQPDWLYQFLHNVKPLRVGLNIRMPSFWTDGPYSHYKTIYPAGRLSAVDPNKREKGVNGEPLPGPDAVKVADVPDDARQIADFFVTDAKEKPYGSQPVLLEGADEKKLYELGKRLVTVKPDPNNPAAGGMGCVECHSVGNLVQPVPKWAPNLANVKRRLKDDWLRRFITFPPSIYPWTNMPNNFIPGWDYNHDFSSKTRGVMEEPKLAEVAEKIKAVKFFLLHSGDAELGADIKLPEPAPPTPNTNAPAPNTPPAPK